MTKKNGGGRKDKSTKHEDPKDDADPTSRSLVGPGGETHQWSGKALTTSQGTTISDNQSSLKAGARGPTLLEDFVLREKITSFDHERIPERIVHARGSGAHGYFVANGKASKWSRAAFLGDTTRKTPVFVRFSTVAGGAGSVDTPRDVRGFAVKFYTQEGNFDLVGNNIPVFFIQDAIKFPDLVHAVKMEADRGFPQAASAHDTFWDFVSLMPETTHMLMWAMSDRGIPRSLRMMEGFGVHTFRLLDENDASTFVKFHWRPTIGSQSTSWDEAVKMAGADPDSQRRDLWEAIDQGHFPEWELSVQAFDQATADSFDFDVLDPTKLVPEELVPLEVIGKLVLDRNPDNFFAETEQVAFHPGHVVPGIDFSEDPLLQGRLFSYVDTQLSRLGSPNFHELPINAPKCPWHNFQRDGHMRHTVNTGRVNYEPNSLGPGTPRENAREGFRTYPTVFQGGKVRERPASFADHYSQARLFWRSMTVPEKRHIASAFAFELGKVETVAIRKRMLGHLHIVDPELCAQVEGALGMPGAHDAITPAREPIDMPPSPALSIVAKAKPTLKGRKIGVLVMDGSDEALLGALRTAVEKAGATLQVVAPKIGGAAGKKGHIDADQALVGAPSVFHDAVVVLGAKPGIDGLLKEAGAADWLRDAYSHLKAIAYTADATPLLDKAAVKRDAAVMAIDTAATIEDFLAVASQGKHWPREVELDGPWPRP